MKKVVAVTPYVRGINFKMKAYAAWIESGGEHMPSHYPPKILHGFFHKYELPALHKNNKIAQLRFVEPVTIELDTFPDYSRYEIIPLIWDCWPIYLGKTCQWFVKHDVRTAIFTSSQTAKRVKEKLPHVNVITITEGINTSLYKGDIKLLKDRRIDILEVGRMNYTFFKSVLPDSINHVRTGILKAKFKTNEDFRKALNDAKVTITVPRCDTQPERAGDIETLTQRYWENMLSGIVMVGRAPKELTDLIGYNPVINWNGVDATNTTLDILNNLDNYQPLVYKNRETAMMMADWSIRIKYIKEQLVSLGYQL